MLLTLFYTFSGGSRCVFFNGPDQKIYGSSIASCDGSYPQYDGGCTKNNGDWKMCDNNQDAYYACRKDVACSKYNFQALITLAILTHNI